MRRARVLRVPPPPAAWRPTPLGAFLLVQGAGLAAAPWWLPHPGAAPLGIALLAAWAIAAVWARRSTAGIAAAWTLPSLVHAGEEVDVQLAVAAGAGAPPLAIAHRDPSSQRWLTTLRLAPGGRAVRTAVGVRFARRGEHRLDPPYAVGELPFGLVRAARPVGAAQPVLVLPALGRAPRQLLRRLEAWSDGACSASRAGDEEIERLRAWQPGDPPRRVHWPSSARTGRLLVAERRATAIRRVAVLVDQGGAGPAGGPRFERLVSAAATLLVRLGQEGWSTTLHLSAGFAGPDGGEPGAPMAIAAALPRQLEALALIADHPADPRAALPRGAAAIICSRRGLDLAGIEPAPFLLSAEDLDLLAGGRP